MTKAVFFVIARNDAISASISYQYYHIYLILFNEELHHSLSLRHSFVPRNEKAKTYTFILFTGTSETLALAGGMRVFCHCEERRNLTITSTVSPLQLRYLTRKKLRYWSNLQRFFLRQNDKIGTDHMRW